MEKCGIPGGFSVYGLCCCDVATAALYFLTFLQQSGNTDAQIPIDTYRNGIVKNILVCSAAMFKVIDVDSACQRVYDPILTDSGGAIFKKFDSIIPLRIGRGNYFDHPVRRTITTILIQFILIANHGNIRFNIVSVILA